MSQQHENHGSAEPHVHRITEARESHTVERDGRARKYAITMTIRIVCFILAFLADGWLRWALMIGAVFLPYVAVVMANGGADLSKREPAAEFYTQKNPDALDAGTVDFEPATGEVIDGTLADETPVPGQSPQAENPSTEREEN